MHKHKRTIYLMTAACVLPLFLLPSGAMGADPVCTYSKAECPDRMPPVGNEWTTAAQVVRTSSPSNCPGFGKVADAEEEFWCMFNRKGRPPGAKASTDTGGAAPDNYACMSHLQTTLTKARAAAVACLNPEKLSSDEQSNINRSISLMDGRLGFLYTWLELEAPAIEKYAEGEVGKLVTVCQEEVLPAGYRPTEKPQPNAPPPPPCRPNTKYHFDLAFKANTNAKDWWTEVPMVPAVVAGFQSGAHQVPFKKAKAKEKSAELLNNAVKDYPWFNIPTPVIANYLTPHLLTSTPGFINQIWRIMKMCEKLPAGTEQNEQNGVDPEAHQNARDFVENYDNKIYIKTAAVYEPELELWDGNIPSAHSINKVCGNNSKNRGNTNVPHSYTNNLLLLGDMIYYNCYKGEKNLVKPYDSDAGYAPPPKTPNGAFSCGTDWRTDVSDIYETAKNTAPGHDPSLYPGEFSTWKYKGMITERIDKINSDAGHQEIDNQMIAWITSYNNAGEETAAMKYTIDNPPCMICHQQ